MNKVFYSIIKYGQLENKTFRGYGYITKDGIETGFIDKKTGKKRIYDCLDKCHQVIGKPDQYKGSFYEISDFNGYEIVTSYSIWFKKIS